MLFSSYTFIIIFLPLLIIAYYIIPEKLRNALLLAASLAFYAWGGPSYLLVMLGSILINYVSGLAVDGLSERPSAKRWAVILTVVLNLSLLGYYKYTDFFIENINWITGLDIPLRHIILPLGISFYTFQGMSYVFDISRGKGKVLKNPLRLALYISFFPQLIAGPIVRYETIAPQLEHRNVDTAVLNDAIFRFVRGLTKKVLLANMIGEYAGICFAEGAGSLTLVSSWAGAIAYTLQIYFDFSGYSDMAIGLGAIFGFSFPENFDHPYCAQSITEFWRRWHISLGTWFRDYVYIPLGGNRKGKLRQFLNIIVVWFLTGFWHGASWNFVIWGLYYALILVLEKSVILKYKEKIPVFFRHIYTIILIVIGFVIFNSPSLSFSSSYISRMFDLTYGRSTWASELIHIFREYGVVILAGCIFSTPVADRILSLIKEKTSASSYEVIKSVIMTVLFLACFMRLVVSSYNPFIYFRF
ncbi:MAG: MBOAT family protein [Lachnospiraceae bacterium]|nr:MBOAT family protein [Lachnospiraceae bacterium]